jgi:hypothetical protein
VAIVAFSTPDPQKDAERIAIGAINELSRSAFGSLAGPVVSSDILGLLGIGGSSSEDAYLQQIESKLDAISKQLTALQQTVDGIKTTTDEILRDVAALQSELQQDTIDIELQAALQAFSDNRILIGENFRTYANAVEAIGGSDPEQRVRGARSLFEVFSTLNLEAIAVGMQKIQALFDPGLSAQKSVPQLLFTRAQPALDLAASHATSTVNLWEEAGGTPWVSDVVPTLQQLNGLLRGGPVAAALKNVADTQSKQTASVFRSFLAVQTQALALLTTAWIRTEQASQIQQLIQSLSAALSAMGKFCDNFLQGDGSMWPGFDAYFKQKVLSSTSKIGAPASQGSWMVYDPHNGGRREGSSFPLNDDWLVWDVMGREYIQVVFRPWGSDGTFGNGVQTPLPAGKLAYVCINPHLLEAGLTLDLYFFIDWGPVSFDPLMVQGVWLPGKYTLPDDLSFVPGLISGFQALGSA